MPSWQPAMITTVAVLPSRAQPSASTHDKLRRSMPLDENEDICMYSRPWVCVWEREGEREKVASSAEKGPHMGSNIPSLSSL